MARLNPDLKYRKMLRSEDVAEILGYHLVHVLKLPAILRRGNVAFIPGNIRARDIFKRKI